ncbi:hypothetical protein AMATHDRAFT_153639 [Amanita thiersii Skay4041]|uniref:AB hydrolase-1 domain-containing protein n=1 Tax=Amanita thiersii Skay4041 TaxID=703135 RepID=A0A2A9NF14_9AGAR|nr:hypothetical protein AMATHDRAFT_153639 [Amanita thiersii Skay4041]
MLGLQVEAFVFNTPFIYPATSSLSSQGSSESRSSPLKMTAKRYTLGNSADNVYGLTLLFAHCIGSHKEQWEPTILRLFHNQLSGPRSRRIREAWSFDWQSHGDSAGLNQEALKTRPDGVCAGILEEAIYEWAPAISAFVHSKHMKGHRIVALGHSAGAAAVLLSIKDFPLSEPPYLSVILIEPSIAPRDVYNSRYEERRAVLEYAVSSTSMRRDTWASRKDAFAYFKSRAPWKLWDERVVRLLVEHGLQEVSGGVKLKCDRRQEAVSYADTEPHFEGANTISRLCHSVHIHLIFGAVNDFVPDFIQYSLSDTSKGRYVASVSKIKRAGHMIVQEQPDKLADSISEILDNIGAGVYQHVRSRL